MAGARARTAAAAGARARVEAKGGGDEDEDGGEVAHTPVVSSFPPDGVDGARAASMASRYGAEAARPSY